MTRRIAILALVIGCAHAFQVRNAKRSPAPRALRSMGEDDDGSWPSDSSDEAAVIDVVGAAVEDVDALKRSLLLAMNSVKVFRRR